MNLGIVSFKDPRLRMILNRDVPKGFPADLAPVLRRKLAMLDHAYRLVDLRTPPGNRLEALKGDRAGQYAIRVNDQFRLCFIWTERGPAEVEFVDYHH